MNDSFIVYPLSNCLFKNGSKVTAEFNIPEGLPQNLQMLHWKDENLGSFYRLSGASENVPLEETDENYNMWVKPFSELWQTEYEREYPVKIQEQLTQAVQNVLDAKAQELLYDNCLSVCSYIDTGVQKFDDEGRAFRVWRSAVWAKGYEILAQVQAGERAIPSEEELLSELPELVITYSEA